MDIKLLYIFSIFLFLFLCITTVYIKNKFKSKYSSDLKISVILYYNDNPKYLSSVLSTIINYKNINEILIIYKGEHIRFKHYKVRFFKDELINEYSSFIRFLYVPKCKNDTILLLNNDIIPSERLIQKLLYRYKNDMINYYGVFQRSCNSSGYKTISLYNNIILSPILLTSKEILERTWEDMIQEKEHMIDENMEDILFQYYFEKIYGKQPILVRGKYKRLSSSLKNFYQYKLKNENCKNLYKKKKYKEEDFY